MNEALFALKECLQSGGLLVTREPTNMFQNVFGADSQFTEKEKNMRPDLYVHGKRDSYYNEYKNIISSLRCEQRKLKKAIFSTLKGVSREISSK